MGVRKNRSTLSALTLLAATIKSAWAIRRDFVVSILSLDISGAYNNVPYIYPLRTRHHNASPPQPTIPLQPVCYRADDLHYNQSATEQTTSTTTVCHTADDLHYDQSTAVALQTTSTTTGARSHHRRTADEPQTQTTTTTTITANLLPLPQTYRRRRSTTVTVNLPPLPQTYHQYRRRTVGYQANALQTTTILGIPQMR